MSIKNQKPAILLHGLPKKEYIDLLKKRKIKEAFVMEGRPKLIGAKVLCRELLKKRIKPVLITDNMAGFLFYKNFVQEIWGTYQSRHSTGALCAIGTLMLGVLGKRHNVSLNLVPSRRKSPVTGSQKDILEFASKRVAPYGIKGYVPLMEFVPQEYISRIFPPTPNS